MIEIFNLAYEHPVWTIIFLIFVLMIVEAFQPVKIVKVYQMKKEKSKDEN